MACRSARHWSAVRAKLATFATITQDGDDEGVARLHDLPAPEQAEEIREAWAFGSVWRSPRSSGRGSGSWPRLSASSRSITARRFGRQDWQKRGGLG